MSAAPGSSSRGARVALLAVTLGALGAGLWGASRLLTGFVRERVVAEAAARGLRVEPGAVHLGLGTLSLEQVRVELALVPGVAITARSIDVLLEGLEPRRAAAEGVAVTIERPLAALAVDLAGWAGRHAGGLTLPVTASGVAITVAERAGAAPWLRLAGGGLGRTELGALFTAEEASVEGLGLARLRAGLEGDRAELTASIAGAVGDRPTVQVVVAPAGAARRVEATLAEVPLDALAAPLGVRFDAPRARIEGRIEAEVGSAGLAGPVRGRLSGAVRGWVPPHPVELEGFLFGDVTELASDFELPAASSRIELRGTRISAGAFALAGAGSLTLESEQALVQLSLGGRLPCAAVADSALRARGGSVLGALLGRAARRLVDGAVDVGVQLTASTRDLAGARIVRRIGIGCGLAPLGGVDAALLARLPPEIRALAEEAGGAADRAVADLAGLAGAASTGLPALPALPGLPALPRLPASGAAPVFPLPFALPVPSAAPAPRRSPPR